MHLKSVFVFLWISVWKQEWLLFSLSRGYVDTLIWELSYFCVYTLSSKVLLNVHHCFWSRQALFSHVDDKRRQITINVSFPMDKGMGRHWIGYFHFLQFYVFCPRNHFHHSLVKQGEFFFIFTKRTSVMSVQFCDISEKFQDFSLIISAKARVRPVSQWLLYPLVLPPNLDPIPYSILF